MKLSSTAIAALSFTLPVASTSTETTTATHKVRRRLIRQQDPCRVIQLQPIESSETGIVSEGAWPWNCELSPEDAQSAGGNVVVPIEGLTDHDFRTMEGMFIEGGSFQHGRLVLPPGSTALSVTIPSFTKEEVDYAIMMMDMDMGDMDKEIIPGTRRH